MSEPVPAAVSRALTQGGDDRVRLTAQGVNKYFVAPCPEDPDTIQRAYCTCSPPSLAGFEACCALLPRLQAGPGAAAAAAADVRARLKACLGLQRSDAEVVLNPSGTDAEYLPLLYALQRCEALGCPGVVNVVAAAGEVGSHTATAASGRHVSSVAWAGQGIEVGRTLEGWEGRQIKLVEVRPRCRLGRLVPDYDAAFAEAVRRAEGEWPGAFFVLHGALTKTGLLLPSHGIIESLLQRLHNRVLLVFDGCQMRASTEEVQWYVARGAIVLLTGSKFFGGPGFSGAVVCPRAVVDEFAKNQHVPPGLACYLARSDVPPCMAALRNALPDTRPNLGLLLRWTCALAELEAFVAHREQLLPLIGLWASHVEKAILCCSPCLELVREEGQPADAHLGGRSTIFCVRMHFPGEAEPSLQDLRQVQLLLMKDLAEQLPPVASPEEREAVRRPCVVGQPVWLGKFGVLRLSLGAPLTRGWLQPAGLERTLQGDQYLLRKWVLVIKYFTALAPIPCHDEALVCEALAPPLPIAYTS